MNQREKQDVASLIASWEWVQGGSISEAMAFARCASSLIETLAFSEDDLRWARTWELAVLMGISDDESAFDAFADFMDRQSYRSVVDQIEDMGLVRFSAQFTTGPTPQENADV